jgi:hypothetical protein
MPFSQSEAPFDAGGGLTTEGPNSYVKRIQGCLSTTAPNADVWEETACIDVPVSE